MFECATFEEPTIQEASRKVRKDCHYTQEERNVIDPFKEAWYAQADTAGRASIFRDSILPAIFKYWKKIGKAPTTQEQEEVQTKALAAWLSNNWRPNRNPKAWKPDMVVKITDIVWRLHKSAVQDAIHRLLENDPTLEGKDNLTLWPRAAMIVYNGMSPEEQEEIHRQKKLLKNKGHDEKTQKKLARKLGARRARQWAKERYLEMGMSTLTFMIFRSPSDRLLVEVEDTMATTMGVMGVRKFIDIEADLIKELNRKLLLYCRKLWDAKETEPSDPVTGEGLSTAAATGSKSNELPELPPPTVFLEMTKKGLTEMMRNYFNHHYGLVTKSAKSHVPYLQISKNPFVFILEKYLPGGVNLCDPQNMRKEHILKVLHHIYERQTLHGITDSFRFSHKLVGGVLSPAVYPDAAGTMATETTLSPHQIGHAPTEDNEEVPKEKQRPKGQPRKSTRKKGKKKQALLPDTNHEPATNTGSINEGHETFNENSNPPVFNHPNNDIPLPYHWSGGIPYIPNVEHHAHSMPVAVNGPNDGKPLYMITNKECNVIQQLIPQSHIPIDPVLLMASNASRQYDTGMVTPPYPLPTPSPPPLENLALPHIVANPQTSSHNSSLAPSPLDSSTGVNQPSAWWIPPARFRGLSSGIVRQQLTPPLSDEGRTPSPGPAGQSFESVQAAAHELPTVQTGNTRTRKPVSSDALAIAEAQRYGNLSKRQRKIRVRKD